MDLNTLIQKIPKTVLVFGVLIIALGLFIYNDPLRDECEIQSSIFLKNTSGILSGTKVRGKTQYAQINYWRDRCKEGNSIGSCEDYFEGLRRVATELKSVNDHCQVKFSEQNQGFSIQLSNALQIMSLVAWGEKPPGGLSERLGWLNASHIRTFCYLKKTFILLGGEENFLALREKVYREYPGEWPEKFDVNRLVESNSSLNDPSKKEQELDIAKLVAENRPRVYKTASNPSGTLNKEQVFERSIFSIRCDLYM